MDIETAKKKLKIEGQFDSSIVKSAYLERVREVRNSEDFETLLLGLNMARDALELNQNDSRDLVPFVARELAGITAKQKELSQINEARDEIRDVFGSVERRSISHIKGSRDIAGLLSAGSAALVFGKESFSELFPFVTDVTLYNQVLLFASAILAFLAFMANRRAKEVSALMEEINRKLTRDRQIDQLLLRVFADEESLDEEDFVFDLRFEIIASTRMAYGWGLKGQILDALRKIGLLAPREIDLGRDFVDDYIEYLLKSGHVKVTGISGKDMRFYKAG